MEGLEAVAGRASPVVPVVPGAGREALAGWGGWSGWLVAGLAIALLQALPPAWREALAFDRAALRGGELWRLVTGHFVHLGWRHAALNLACLAVCMPLMAYRRRALPTLAGLAASSGLLLWAGAPRVAHYVGLSGVIYALAVLGLAPLARQGWPARLLLLAVLARVGWQAVVGSPAAEAAWLGGPVRVEGHLAGIAAACLWLAGAAAWRIVREWAGPDGRSPDARPE
ncbi:rhombosortase [Burkholderia gladioli]|uniref:rhombosortase n=1 Tax=Burkholderia gladioli TaxID=28095 RepID=UPI00156163B5|nr:rhombosortase [Burkholderia gladioli]NRF87199.1 rhombosortase [Burkholderia gladioli]